jgi:hypothetical protein
MSIFKTVDGASIHKKSQTESRLGVTIHSGAFRPNKPLRELIKKEGGQVKLHLLQEDVGFAYQKGDLFLEVVSKNGININDCDRKPQFQSRTAADLIVESIGRPIKSINCKVASEPVQIEGMNMYALITASAIIKE